MLLADRIQELTDAAFSGLWIVSAEPDEAIQEMRQLAARLNWEIEEHEPNPTYAPVTAMLRLIATTDDEEDQTQTKILILPSAGQFTEDPIISQTMYRTIQTGKKIRRFLVVIDIDANIPPRLAKSFVVVDHDLPTRTDLKAIAQQIGTQEGELPKGPQMELLIDAACGLTRYEAEGAFSLALIRNNAIGPAEVWEIKSGAIKKTGGLSLYTPAPEDSFDRLGGMEHLKRYTKRSLRVDGKVRPKGVLLLGPSGTGKSQFAKMLGAETGRPCLMLDIGGLMGSLVGSTETALRQALKVADAMSPCILFIDEIEKGLAGAGTDTSGVATRIVGTLLTWLNDHTTDVYVVATSNDISKLPPELTRAGRFDATFFLDLPNAAARAAIWPIYCKRFELDQEQPLPETEGWTGAEIEGCSRLAALHEISLTDAAVEIIPVSTTKAEAIEGLRSWAAGKCSDAERDGTYTRNRSTSTADAPRRAIKRTEG